MRLVLGVIAAAVITTFGTAVSPERSASAETVGTSALLVRPFTKVVADCDWCTTCGGGASNHAVYEDKPAGDPNAGSVTGVHAWCMLDFPGCSGHPSCNQTLDVDGETQPEDRIQTLAEAVQRGDENALIALLASDDDRVKFSPDGSALQIEAACRTGAISMHIPLPAELRHH